MNGEEIQSRYNQNVARGNWPEARYEWEVLHGLGDRRANPFDQTDDKLDQLEFLVRRGDFTEAHPAFLWVRSHTPGGYRQQDLERYAQLIDPVARQLEELEACESKGDYAKCLVIVRSLEEGRWQIKAVNKSRILTQLQISQVMEAAQNQNYEAAYQLMRTLNNAPLLRAEKDCRERWIQAVLTISRTLADIKNFDLALEATRLLGTKEWELSEEQQADVARLQKLCFAMRIAAALDQDDLSRAMTLAAEALPVFAEGSRAIWPDVALLPDAITGYWKRKEKAQRLEGECKFGDALRLLLEVPEPLQICGTAISRNRIERLQDLVARRNQADAAVASLQRRLVLARLNHQYCGALRSAKEYVRYVRRASQDATQIFSIQELQDLLADGKGQRKRARRRALLALLTGAMLLRGISHWLRGR